MNALSPTPQDLLRQSRSMPGKRDPERIHALIRTQTPILRDADSGMWYLFGWQDCDTMLRSKDFCAPDLIQRSPRFDTSPSLQFLAQTLSNLDPPYHTRLRGQVQKSFSTLVLRRSEAYVDSLIAEAIARLRERDTFDAIADYAALIPHTVICEMLGVPRADHGKFGGWLAAQFRLISPEPPTDQVLDEVDDATRALLDYMADLIAERARTPKIGGVAYADGRVFFAALDGRLIALNAHDGKPIWQTQTIDDSTQPYVITGAPRVAKGLVFIGNSGADLGVRGYVGAYDAATGKRAWRFYTVPTDPARGADHAASDPVMTMAARTWTGHFWTQGGGGTVWNSITYDPDFDRLYIGVGNGAPSPHRPNPKLRSPGGGDNLFTSSIVALDRRTGRYICRWRRRHYQTTPADAWDYDDCDSMVLATLNRIGGAQRRVLMQAPKNGFFYVIDRADGRLISAQHIVPMAKAISAQHIVPMAEAADTPRGQPISWAYGVDLRTGRPLENAAARYPDGTTVVIHPGGPGAHGWEPMGFSPETGLAYMPVQDVASLYKADPDYEPQPYARASGLVPPGSLPQDAALRAAIPAMQHAALLAWDPITNKPAWRVKLDFTGNGGVLTTAGGLVFEGRAGGEFDAYDASHGTKLWSFDAQATAQGGPVSYEIGGMQYVAIAIGNGGSSYLAGALGVPQKTGTPTGRVLAFKLGGAAPYDRVNTALAPVPAPPLVAASSPQTIAAGSLVFGKFCAGCHGFAAISGQVTPDLRRSAVIGSPDAFTLIVQGGALLGSSMPKFGGEITDAQLKAMRAFLASEAGFLYRAQMSAREGSAPPHEAGPQVSGGGQ